MENIEYIIQRYETYPPENSDSFIVGFKILDKTNNKSAYAEGMVPLSEISGKTSNEICQMIYTKIKPQIDIVTNDLISKRNSLTGFTFIPNA